MPSDSFAHLQDQVESIVQSENSIGCRPPESILNEEFKIFYVSLMVTTRENLVIITQKNMIKKLKHIDQNTSEHTHTQNYKIRNKGHGIYRTTRKLLPNGSN